jgi:DNA polymerase-3 subunit epsilon
MWQLPLQRRWYRSRARGTALDRCWAAPCPPASTEWQHAEFLAIDAEMSSLNPRQGELLSVGWVVIREGHAALHTAEHHLLRTLRGVGQSAVVHQLRDCELAAGMAAGTMLERLLQVAQGRILVLHHAPLDMAYLNRLSREIYGAPLLLPLLDTLALERDKLERQGKVPEQGSLRLVNCRRRYHLPDYPAHNALIDALSTAELFIAQMRCRGGSGRLTLRELPC